MGAVGRRPIWLAVPAALLLLVVVGVPVGLNVYLSFFDITISNLSHWLSAPFAALRNYGSAITSPTTGAVSAVDALVVSIEFSVVTTVIAAPIGLLVALSLNHRFRGRAALRSVYLVPYVLPTFVTAVVARMMFMNGSGLVDKALALVHLGGPSTYWLLGPNAFWAMVATDVWASWPFIYIMALAGLSSVPADLYEAAEIDGAGYKAKIRWIVLPQLRNVLALALLLSTIYHFGNFTLPFVMFGNPPPAPVDVLPIDIYYRAFTSFQYGIAAATAVLTLAVMAVPGYVYLRMTRLASSGAQ
jgi:multiple sugar transport system permease protein